MREFEPRSPKARAAGQRLRRYVENLAAQRGVTSTAELAERSGVGRDTLHVWYRGGRTPTPRGAGQLARFLGVEYGDLMAAWDGREATRQAPLSDEEIERIVDRLRPEIERIVVGLLRPAKGRGAGRG